MHLASITPENLQKLVDSKLSVSEICENLKLSVRIIKPLLKNIIFQLLRGNQAPESQILMLNTF